MTARTALRIGLVLWTAAFILAFVDFRLTEPTGDSFTRGLNRIGKFVIWQGVAIVIAIAVWVIGLRFEKKSAQRVASRIPGLIAIAMLVALGLFILSANFFSGRASSTPEPPKMPSTEAMPLQE